MKTLNVEISDLEFSKFGLKATNYSFSEWVEIISRELTRQKLSQSIELAEKYGLSSMSMEEITSEVKAIRDAKSNT